MSTTRNGKIARLPRAVRQQLNTHLDDGMEGEPLLAWVNGLPETQALLREKFDGKAINPQNLSDWRQGGYQDWLRARERIELAQQLEEQAQDLEQPEGTPRLSGERLGLILTIELAAKVKQWQAGAEEPRERWRQLRELLRELSQLRRDDNQAHRTRIAQEKWEWQTEAIEEEQQQQWQEAHDEKVEALVKKVTYGLFTRGVSPQKVLLAESEVREAFRAGKPLPQSVQELFEQSGAQPRNPSGRAEGASPNTEVQSHKSCGQHEHTKSKGRKSKPGPRKKSKHEKSATGPAGKGNIEDGKKASGATSEADARTDSPADPPNQGESSPIKPDQTENEEERPWQNDEIQNPSPESENKGNEEQEKPDGLDRGRGREGINPSEQENPEGPNKEESQSHQSQPNPTIENVVEEMGGEGETREAQGPEAGVSSPALGSRNDE
jgi:hypothetical protein